MIIVQRIRIQREGCAQCARVFDNKTIRARLRDSIDLNFASCDFSLPSTYSTSAIILSDGKAGQRTGFKVQDHITQIRLCTLVSNVRHIGEVELPCSASQHVHSQFCAMKIACVQFAIADINKVTASRSSIQGTDMRPTV